MAPLWEDVKNAIVEGYVYASDKAEEVTQIGRAKVEIMKLNRQIARLMGDIGGRVFEAFEAGEEAGLGEDNVIADAIAKIKDCQKAIKRWEKEIEQARVERDQAQS